MSCHRLALNAAAGIATLFALGADVMAADCMEQLPTILELQPGMTKIMNPCQTIQAIVIGNPNVADASAININTIAITGKGAGLTNFILFDDQGQEVSNTNVQVVDANAYRSSDNVRARHEIRVSRMWRGASIKENKDELPRERRYLCAQNCATIQVEEPTALNPPGNTSAPVGATSKSLYTFPSPQGPTPGASTPPGGSAPGQDYTQ
jgi:hypothetical protein